MPDMAEMRKIAQQKRQERKEWQEQMTYVIDWFRLRPVIGSTGSAKRVGWEMKHIESGYETYHEDEQKARFYMPKALENIKKRKIGYHPSGEEKDVLNLEEMG